ncbi:chitobiase/beta-hexosaminidase C-terminal domain-containing protein [Paenibacillus xerothermodurans]|uniref:Dockerin domain-containing protein n=1 Tax=Paenibacillus xerothermodurans TaxID=1977292 RepID=A0A2W1N5P1_PAEXE|nr:chitobiase/beta-hexosaminidase C-terminal domain-containing protein [Paenibacillus xerothermodurans]PZE20019.1 hypothetical protein CBW46_015160 [Paenibacillus xerothermodurans]
MNLLSKAGLWALLLLLMCSGVASAAASTVTDDNGRVIITGSSDGTKVTLSLEYADLTADFTGFNLELEVPAPLDALSGKFESGNPAIQLSAADNYDTTVGLYKLIILNPALSASPQGRSGKIGDVTFRFKVEQSAQELAFLVKTVRVYGGGEQLIHKRNERYALPQPDTTKPIVAAQPAGGTYGETQTVTLTLDDNDPAAEIHYTLDGETPTASSLLYTSPLTIDRSTTLQFIGIDTAGNQSDVAAELYDIDMTGPTVTEAKLQDEKTLTVAFDEAVDAVITDVTSGHFQLHTGDSSQTAVEIESVTLNADKSVATLTMAAALEKHVHYKLTVQGVRDLLGNAMADTYATTLTMKDTPPVNQAALFLEQSADIIEPGDEFKVIIKADANDVYGFDISLTYDPAFAQLIDAPIVHSDFGAEGTASLLFNDDKAGTLRIIGTRLGAESGVSGRVGLVELNFKAQDKDGMSGFVITTDSQLADSRPIVQSLPTAVSGGIAIADPDVGGGGLAVNDLVLVARAFGKSAGDSGYLESVDMNKDGKINIIDIAYVAYKLLK